MGLAVPTLAIHQQKLKTRIDSDKLGLFFLSPCASMMKTRDSFFFFPPLTAAFPVPGKVSDIPIGTR